VARLARRSTPARKTSARGAAHLMERLLERVLFEAPDMRRAGVVDKSYVKALKDISGNEDLSRYIL